MKILGSGSTISSACGAVGCELCEDELAPYFDDDDGNHWDFEDVPVDFLVNVRASPLRDFDAVCESFQSANILVSEDGSRVFILA